MSKFPMIEKIGLSVFGMDVIKAEDLEAILQSAQMIYGVMDENKPNEFDEFNYSQAPHYTHKALLLCPESIKKKTKAEAALEFLKKCKDGDIYEMHSNEVMIEAKRILEMKDEV